MNPFASSPPSLPVTRLADPSRRQWALLATAVAAAAAAPRWASAQAPTIAAGQPAPDLALAIPGGAQRLSDLRGKVVYLDFWASWCGPCRQSFPWMNELQRKHGARGLQVVGMNLDANRADADRFLAQVPAQFALAFDAKGESPRLYQVKTMPSSVLIGADGRIEALHKGFLPEQAGELEARIVAALEARK